jgi:hypothetical protein
MISAQRRKTANPVRSTRDRRTAVVLAIAVMVAASGCGGGFSAATTRSGTSGSSASGPVTVLSPTEKLVGVGANTGRDPVATNCYPTGLISYDPSRPNMALAGRFLTSKRRCMDGRHFLLAVLP